MGHGLPDGALSGKSTTIFGLLDMAELAVRLGSFNSFDRLGNVVWMDDFESGLGSWIWSGGGANNAVSLYAGESYRGGLSALLHPGEVDDGGSEIVRVLPYPVLGGIGLEAAFVPQANLKLVRIGLALYDGADKYLFYARYNHVDGTIEVRTGDVAYEPVGEPGVQAEGFHNHCVLKMVANCKTGEYARVIFNDHTYDASGHFVFTEPDTVTKPTMKAYIVAVNSGIFLIDIPVDCVIVTQNEPV